MSGGGLGIAHLADIEAIGSGGTGVMYAATDQKLDRRVAVRVFDPLTEGAQRDRFRSEAKVLGSLSSHPSVVTIYDAGFTEGEMPFLLMELVDGDDLATVLAQRGTLGWTEATDIVLQLCAGLGQAHGAGLLHRDLRLDNVMMVGPAPKLTDFGISAGQVPGPSGRQSDDASVMSHRAPETFTGLWDERTDLYSLGSMLYEMIDGKPPFHRPGDNSVDALRLRLIHEHAPGLDIEAVPMALSVFVQAALSKDPFDRPQSAEEFAHELRLVREGRTTGSIPSVLHGTGGTLAVSDPTVAAPPPPRPEVAPLSFSNEAPAEPSVVNFAANAAAVTQNTVPPAVMAPLVAASAAPFAPAPAAPMPGGALPTAYAPEPSQSWAPPPGDGNTAVYSDFSPSAGPAFAPPKYGGPNSQGGPLDQPYEAPIEHRSGKPLDIDHGVTGLALHQHPDEQSRSPVFLAAMAMIAIGLLGLAVVAAISAFGGDDEQQTAPLLPDPDQAVAAEGEDGAITVGGSTATTVAGEAMEDATTTIEAMEEDTTTTTVQRFPIPQLVGMSVQAATQRLTDEGFEVVVVGRQSTGPPGIVTAQKPDAGAQVTQPLAVTLYIPRVTNLPTMVGRSADAVCLELQALSLTCTRILAYNDQIPVGSVVSSNPIEGSLFAEGSSVELTVSLGPVRTVAIPDVLGQTATQAETTLTVAGFGVFAFVVEASDTVPVDQAVGSNPAAGSTLATNQLVTVRISSGPAAKVTVPQLAGMSTADAEAALSGLGLTSTVAMVDLPAGDENIGKVISSDPGAGTEVSVGSAVAITVGQQMPESAEGNE